MRLSLIIGLLLIVTYGKAQEFNAQLNINYPKLQTVDPKVFGTLETALTQLINNTAWTNDIYESFERIDLSMTLNITEEVSPTSFKADLLIQATRPIYNSSEKTVLFTHSDNQVTFNYEEYQPMEFTQNSYNNNLTSIISFYCYMIIGFDYDSFALNGGTPYFQEAQNILTTIPPNLVNSLPGWSSVGKQRNRYWLIENVLSPRVVPYREAMYSYHLKGLDRMADDVAAGRQAIANAITKVNQVNRAYPNAMIIQTFANSKRNEILEIFVNADPAQKRKVYDAMIKIDASNASRYRALQ